MLYKLYNQNLMDSVFNTNASNYTLNNNEFLKNNKRWILGLIALLILCWGFYYINRPSKLTRLAEATGITYVYDKNNKNNYNYNNKSANSLEHNKSMAELKNRINELEKKGTCNNVCTINPPNGNLNKSEYLV